MEDGLLLMAMGELSPEEMTELLIIEEEKYRKKFVVRSSRYPRLNLESLTSEECRSLFRFAKNDLHYLREVLRIPCEIKTENRYRVSGLEGLCIYLRRLAYPSVLSDLVPLFGLSTSYLSCVCKYVMNHIQTEFGHLLLDFQNLLWLNEKRLREYSEAVCNRGATLQNCWGFIDSAARAICRPTQNQKEFYAGDKLQHCLKYQSVLCPDGIIVNLQGPYSGRKHDTEILDETNLYSKLKQVAVFDERKYSLYGNTTYPVTDLIKCPYLKSTAAEQKTFNDAMSKVWTAAEWGFGKVAAEFAFLDFKKNLKLELQDVGRMYSTAVLLSNCHTCLYGSQTGNYFQMQPPTLETYLSS